LSILPRPDAIRLHGIAGQNQATRFDALTVTAHDKGVMLGYDFARRYMG